MVIKLLILIKKNLRSVILGSFVVLLAISFYNLFQVSLISSNTPTRKQHTLPKIDKQTLVTLNYRALKRKAMDSLIDNNILTTRNIEIIDSIYPDSLCKCGEEFYSLSDSLSKKN